MPSMEPEANPLLLAESRLLRLPVVQDPLPPMLSTSVPPLPTATLEAVA